MLGYLPYYALKIIKFQLLLITYDYVWLLFDSLVLIEGLLHYFELDVCKF